MQRIWAQRLPWADMLMGVQFDAGGIKSFIQESNAAQHLCSIGYAQDVEFIARVNVFDIVPVYDGKVIRQAGLYTQLRAGPPQRAYPMIDTRIVHCMQAAAVDMVVSLPCNMLSGILDEIDRLPIKRIPVCREEEGVGIAAGAALAGKRPVLLMQNSGLGNCVNALASLTGLYRLPLFLLMSHRGGPGRADSSPDPHGAGGPRAA